MTKNYAVSIRLEPTVHEAAQRLAAKDKRDLNDYLQHLITTGLISRGAFASNPKERAKLEEREHLLNQVAEKAEEIWSRGGDPEDITVLTCRELAGDAGWLARYKDFIENEDAYAKKVALKKRINPRIGSRIAAALGLQAKPKDGMSGPAKTIQVSNEIIQVATALQRGR